MLLLSYRFEKGFLLRDRTLQRKVILKAGGSAEIGNALSINIDTAAQAWLPGAGQAGKGNFDESGSCPAARTVAARNCP